jgi:acetyl-CoA C-acetyltransferase
VTVDPRAPVIVGSGQVLQHDLSDVESGEPVALIAGALRAAGEDSATGERLLRAADSVRCVPVLGWQYRNAAALVGEELGARPRETVQCAAIGGEGPQLLLNDTARAIAEGEVDIALVGGGESIASVRAAELEGRIPPWRRQGEDVRLPRTLGRDRQPLNAAEVAAGLAPPVCMYALIETAVRAAEGSTPEAHLTRIAGLWSRFSAVAAENPNAWIRRRYTSNEIATAATENRLVSAPYTKLLTANIQVNMASGLIVTSAEAARRAGVPKDRWVFIHAGAQAEDEWHVTERDRLAASPAIETLGRAVLRHAGVAIDDIAHVDLYSCFPSAVQIAARELGLATDRPDRPLTVTGGLTFGGGPGNNYAGHAIATLVQRLREDPGAYGLATAVGWYLTKHAIGIYSARPPAAVFLNLDPKIQRPPTRRARADYTGPATIEAYTVVYQRDGNAETTILTALTPEGERAVIRTPDREVIDAVASEDRVGWRAGIGAQQRLTIEQAPL